MSALAQLMSSVKLKLFLSLKRGKKSQQQKIKELSTANDPRSRAIFDNLELQLALYLCFEPTIADLLARPMSISNATLHEFILMRLKEVTLIFTKNLEKNTRKKETTRLENELTL